MDNLWTMNQKQRNKLMQLSPSGFYLWLWKKYFSKQIDNKQKDKLIALYETHRDKTEESVKEVFGP